MTGGDSYISGWKTGSDWHAFRSGLTPGRDVARWLEAFDQYFHTRLELRYLNPIRTLQENGTLRGEGFSILAIQCTLVEFLESTVQGIKYRYLRKGESLGPHEYTSSRGVFVAFLCNREPFAKEFDVDLANDFYAGVRCGLLHEARTKNGWRVWARSPAGKVINRDERIVYRNNFQDGLESFIAWYRGALSSDAALQEAFIRKFDDLCE